jgi:D-alanyl-D-alanine carboxypeptidase/D-alanyl-D-alanine-endopeptidase (penicillin-binding protein 4)
VLFNEPAVPARGDPTLTTDGLGDLAARLAARGVRGVTGRFLVHAGGLPNLPEIDREQPDHVGYNPAISGLNLNFNRVHFEWRRAGGGWATTMDARSDRFRPDVRTARMAVVNRSLPIYTYESGEGVDRWTVASAALGEAGSRWLPVRHPTEYCAEVLAHFLRAEGVATPPPERVAALPEGFVIAELESAALRGVLRDMLEFSTNLTAEVVGLTASAQSGAMPASLAESGARMSVWLRARTGAPSPALVDHSGLGERNRISAADMVAALVALGPAAGLAPILKPIPMRDAAYKLVENHPATVAAKTGTLNFVSALAGYVTLRGARQIAFATFTADTTRRAAIPRAEREAPQGASPWAQRSRTLQMRLIDRWSRLT